MSNQEAFLSWREELFKCTDGASLREWWTTTTNLQDMLWLIGRAHIRQTLGRRLSLQRLVVIAIRCVETVAYMLPRSMLEHVATVNAWARGEYVTTEKLRHATRSLELKADNTPSFAAAEAACATIPWGDRALAVSYVVGAVNNALLSFDHKGSHTAMCDVIRDEISIDEVCAALYLNPDERMTP